MKKIIILILILIISTVYVVLFNKEDTVEVENVQVATSADVISESDQYQNGLYWGFIKKSTIQDDKLILSIDFLQSFNTKKDQLIAAIEDDFCKNPSNLGFESKEIFLEKVKSLNESDVDDFISTTKCFPNGMNYFRDTEYDNVEKMTKVNFKAKYVSGSTGELIDVVEIIPLNTLLNSGTKNDSNWQITISNNEVVEISEIFRP